MYKNRRFLVTLLGSALVINLVLIAWNVYDATLLFNRSIYDPPDTNRPVDIVLYVVLSIIGFLILFPVVYISRLLSLVPVSIPDKVLSATGLWRIRTLFTIQLLSFLLDFVAGYQMAIHHHGNFRADEAYSTTMKQWVGILYFTGAVTNGGIAFLGIGLHKSIRIAAREKMFRSLCILLVVLLGACGGRADSGGKADMATGQQTNFVYSNDVWTLERTTR